MLLKIDQLKTWLLSGGQTVKAVDGVTIEISRGETFCLVGESGSGKSITALSVMRLLPGGISSHPAGAIYFTDNDGGSINLLQQSDSAMTSIRGGRIAMIFQEPMTSLNPVFTVGEQIIEALLLHHPSIDYRTARQRAVEALDQVQIVNPEQRMADYPHKLSGGQRQRVMIAMAMACEPELLIADEPTTALDVTVQREILKLMRDLQARTNMAILFITHDLGVVAQMADRLAVMQRGKIVESGSVPALLRQPQHPYTKKLLAALPENLTRQRQQQVATQPAIDPEPSLVEARPLLECRQISVWFPIKRGLMRRTVDQIKAVDGVDISIRQGEILALVGESGCGKTTLGRAIMRLIEPTAGAIWFSGEAITKLDRRAMLPFRSRMQIIFQDPASSLNPRLTIATTLTEPMAVHGIGESADERLAIAGETLRQVQLKEEYLWRYPHEFSGGERQRIGIARALVLNPRFIVCDEVTSALDVSVQADILQMLLALRDQRQLALLFITHDIGVVEYISDETAVMHQGKIVERGATDQVCSHPTHPYSKKLLSAVPRLLQ